MKSLTRSVVRDRSSDLILGDFSYMLFVLHATFGM